jgi:DNA-binding transcriptional regulator GbsR (MarR family)
VVDEVRQRYVEERGLLFERFGLPRMAGRVLGVLLISAVPERPAEELADTLQASRGSISTTTRMLERVGLIERISKPGERRDYFRNKPGAWHNILRRELESVSVMRRMAEEGLKILDSSDPEARRGLEEMLDIYAFMERELPAVFARWEKESKER